MARLWNEAAWLRIADMARVVEIGFFTDKNKGHTGEDNHSRYHNILS